MEIEKLNSVFIISSDYGSLGDLSNLIIDFEADSVYIPTTLEKSFIDIINQSNQHEYSQRLIVYPNSPKKTANIGYSLLENGIIANFGEEHIFISNTLDPECVDLISKRDFTTIVIGNPAYQFSAIYKLLNQTKLNRLIISRINDDQDNLLQKQLISNQLSEFELINLDKAGFYHISIPK